MNKRENVKSLKQQSVYYLKKLITEKQYPPLKEETTQFIKELIEKYEKDNSVFVEKIINSRLTELGMVRAIKKYGNWVKTITISPSKKIKLFFLFDEMRNIVNEAHNKNKKERLDRFLGGFYVKYKNR